MLLISILYLVYYFSVVAACLDCSLAQWCRFPRSDLIVTRGNSLARSHGRSHFGDFDVAHRLDSRSRYILAQNLVK